MTPDKRIMCSYVWHKDVCFFISTIDRDSSDGYRHLYAETLVWEYDWENRQRGDKIIYSDGDLAGHIDGHVEICKSFHDRGKGPEEE